MNEMPKVDAMARKALSDDAHALLEDKAFLKAIADLRKHWFDELMIETTPRKQDELVAKMKALEDIPRQILSYVTDERIAQKRRA
jgi:hypothetical protein